MAEPFDVKKPELLIDPIHGAGLLVPAVRGMLEWQCEMARIFKWPRFMVTCFGRTRIDQEREYTPTYLKELLKIGWPDTPETRLEAARRAHDRFSWHCVALPKREVSAYDLRSGTHSAEQRAKLMKITRVQYPTAEILHHAVEGGGFHFHFSLPDKHRPTDWL